MFVEPPADSWTESSHNLQDFSESMLPRNITLDDISQSRRYWKAAGEDSRDYLRRMEASRSSPWGSPLNLFIIPAELAGVVRARPTDWIPLLPSSFKTRFHKASVRLRLLMALKLVERDVGSNISGTYWEWFDKISNRDERWSFLEYLEDLEMSNFRVNCLSWLVGPPINEGQYTKSPRWRDHIELLSFREQEDLIKYPELTDGAWEPPDSLKRLISSRGLAKDVEISLMQAWPSFLRNWPQTARFTVFALNNSGDALAKLEEWMEAVSVVVTVPREEGSGIQH